MNEGIKDQAIKVIDEMSELQNKIIEALNERVNSKEYTSNDAFAAGNLCGYLNKTSKELENLVAIFNKN